MRRKRVLLVEPEFPAPNKSRNHKSILPIGLLKLAAYHRKKGDKIQLARGNLPRKEIKGTPDLILVTSLFTYWCQHVRDTVTHYKRFFPKTKTVVGGIYASLMPEHCREFTGCDEVHVGVYEPAEHLPPAYDLVEEAEPLGFQIIHASRGCVRRCRFCGAWKIEPRTLWKKTLSDEIHSNRLVFYDNNLLANPHIRALLEEIAETRYDGKTIRCEAQCGFDGRLLTQELASLLRKARFDYPKIAWDGPYSDWPAIKKQIRMLENAGYPSKDISVFVLYNWEIPFSAMERKRKKLWEWKVQVSDCRYRPLSQIYDNYNPRASAQTNEDYFIHSNWTDKQIKTFRRNVRRQNICVRQGLWFYSGTMERRKVGVSLMRRMERMSRSEIQSRVRDVWFPQDAEIHLEARQKVMLRRVAHTGQ